MLPQAHNQPSDATLPVTQIPFETSHKMKLWANRVAQFYDRMQPLQSIPPRERNATQKTELKHAAQSYDRALGKLAQATQDANPRLYERLAHDPLFVRRQLASHIIRDQLYTLIDRKITFSDIDTEPDASGQPRLRIRHRLPGLDWSQNASNGAGTNDLWR